MSEEQTSGVDYKHKALQSGTGSAFSAYRRLMYGRTSLWYVLKAELIALLVSWLPGALGLLLRKWLYPTLFKRVGRNVVFGRNVTLRHAHKIVLGDGVVVDDHAVLDAKGESNEGIVVEDGVYVGRNTIIYCKNGNIRLGRSVNISSNCQLFSSNELTVGSGTVIAAYVYLLSGGQYDYSSRIPFAEQSGMVTRGPTRIGENGWIGAGVVVVDGSVVGNHVVVGAGAVVSGEIPADSLALGIPAKVVRAI
ncbi:MAG: hypothetical protein LBN38_00260 [Verrucomicrobiota bacterium]|jgi:acetyltransferase-like isoleucine patch superfamily enzyme|nr:hypothetical protein [Verrucomicrobiota bacterium]